MHQLVDQDFKDTLHQGHRYAIKVEVWQDNKKIRTLSGAEVTDGNVRMDDAEFRTQIDLTLQDELGDLTPRDTFSNILEPGFSYVKAWRGLYLPEEDEPVLIPLGAAVVDEVRADESGASRTISVNCLDWATKLHEDTFPSTFTIAKGQWVWYSLQRLIVPLLEDWQRFIFRGDAALTSGQRTYKSGESRWTKARELAKSIGCELFFDEELNLVCEPIPGVGDPCDEFSEGSEGKLLYGSKIRSVQGIYNSVKVIGENTKNNAIYSGLAEDRNPFSPTNIDRFGRRAYETSDGNVQSNTAAAIMALGLLRKMVGRPERMELTTIVNPGLRLNDTVKVEREALGVNTLQVLDKLTIPLVPDRGMSLSMRERIVEA